jgi:hypothetical protein
MRLFLELAKRGGRQSSDDEKSETGSAGSRGEERTYVSTVHERMMFRVETIGVGALILG